MALLLTVLGILAVAAVLIFSIVRTVQWRQRQAALRSPKSPEEELAEQVRELDRRAQLELQAGRFEAARGLFLAAKRPGKAAQVAVREGKFALAGELFERAGALDKALFAYGKAKNGAKVKELEIRLGRRVPSAAPAASDAQPALEGSAREGGAAPVASAQDLADAPAPWNNMSDADADAWLLDDGLLALPEAEPPKPVEPPPSAAGAVGRAALGVIGLIKSRKSRAVVEETVARRHDDR